MYLGDPLLSILAFCGLSATVWQIATHLYLFILSLGTPVVNLQIWNGLLLLARRQNRFTLTEEKALKKTVTVGTVSMNKKENSPNSTKLKATIYWSQQRLYLGRSAL